jgi:cytochrome P450
VTIPELSGPPIIGNVLELRKDPIAVLERLRRECGDLGLLRLGPRSVAISSAPRHAEIVLALEAEAFEKGPTVRSFARPILGEGLISCSNAVHKKKRRLVSPAFHQRQIASYAAMFSAEADRARAGWREGEVIDLWVEMQHLALFALGRALFDVDLVEAPEIASAMSEILEYVTDRIQSPLALPLAIPTPRHQRTKSAIATIEETIERMIEERSSRGLEEKRGDLISMLVFARDEDGSALDRAEIRDEIMTLLVAGHETSANALAWTWHLLMSAPQVVARLEDELDRVLGGRLPGFEDLVSLPFTKQVLKESMRLYPPVHSLGREAQRAVSLGEHVLRPGDLIAISSYLIHRREDLYPDPLRFDPERFTPEAEARLDRYAYLPFGSGPRSCVGSQFAMCEAMLCLATIAQRTQFVSAASEPVRPEMLVTLRPQAPGIRAFARPRS